MRDMKRYASMHELSLEELSELLEQVMAAVLERAPTGEQAVLEVLDDLTEGGHRDPQAAPPRDQMH